MQWGVQEMVVLSSFYILCVESLISHARHIASWEEKEGKKV